MVDLLTHWAEAAGPLRWAVVLAAGLASAWSVRCAVGVARGEPVRAGAWLAGPLGVAATSLLSSAATQVAAWWAGPTPATTLTAAASQSQAGFALAVGLLAASAVAMSSAWMPALAWMRAFGRVPEGAREAGRAAVVLAIGGGALAAAWLSGPGGVPWPLALGVAGAASAPALGVRAGWARRRGRPDVRGRGAEADRGALALVALGVVLGVAGLSAGADAEAWAALSAETLGDGRAVQQWSAWSSQWWGGAGLALASLLAVAATAQLGRGRRARLSRRGWGPLRAALVGLVVAGLSRGAVDFALGGPLDAASAVDAWLEPSALPRLDLAHAAGLRPALDADETTALVVHAPRPALFDAADRWRLAATTDETLRASSWSLAPDVSLAVGGGVVLSALEPAAPLHSELGGRSLLVQILDTQVDGAPVLVRVPFRFHILPADGPDGLQQTPDTDGRADLWVRVELQERMTVQTFVDRCVEALAVGGECVVEATSRALADSRAEGPGGAADF